MGSSVKKKYKEIISGLAKEFGADNENEFSKKIGEVEQNFIDRNLYNTTSRVSKLLDLHYQHINGLADFLIDSIENKYAQLNPKKCEKYLVQIVEREYEKLERKVPGLLHESQLFDEGMCASFKQGVITKRDVSKDSLENKCALLEERWRQRRKWYRDPKWIIGIIIAVILAVLSWFVPDWIRETRNQVIPEPARKILKVVPVDPNTGKTALNIRTKERVEELKNFIIKEKIDSWLFRKHPSFKVTKDDGSVIEYSNTEYSGSVINIFWSKDYIDPFLSKGIKRILDETGQECRTNGLRAEEPLKEAAALLNGIIWNIYDRMAEVDSRLQKQGGDSEKVFKKSVDGKIKVMDGKLREHLRAAIELYSDSSQ